MHRIKLFIETSRGYSRVTNRELLHVLPEFCDPELADFCCQTQQFLRVKLRALTSSPHETRWRMVKDCKGWWYWKTRKSCISYAIHKKARLWKSSAPKLFSTILTNLGTTLATLCTVLKERQKRSEVHEKVESSGHRPVMIRGSSWVVWQYDQVIILRCHCRYCRYGSRPLGPRLPSVMSSWDPGR